MIILSSKEKQLIGLVRNMGNLSLEEKRLIDLIRNLKVNYYEIRVKIRDNQPIEVIQPAIQVEWDKGITKIKGETIKSITNLKSGVTTKYDD